VAHACSCLHSVKVPSILASFQVKNKQRCQYLDHPLKAMHLLAACCFPCFIALLMTDGSVHLLCLVSSSGCFRPPCIALHIALAYWRYRQLITSLIVLEGRPVYVYLCSGAGGIWHCSYPPARQLLVAFAAEFADSRGAVSRIRNCTSNTRVTLIHMNHASLANGDTRGMFQRRHEMQCTTQMQCVHLAHRAHARFAVWECRRV
jgi:hypothetical protein